MTDNLSLISSGTVASGATIIPVVSVASIYQVPNGGAPYYPGWVGNPSITPNGGGVDLQSINVVTPSITIANPTTGTIAAGATLYLGTYQESNSFITTNPSLALDNCAIFGFAQHAPLSGVTLSWTNCATDSNPTGQTGLTVVNPYASQFVAASGVATSGSIDARPKAGNGLNIGTFNAAYPTDLFGQPYAAVNPTVGAIQFPASVPSSAKFFRSFP
jgi:hypothetical protein